MLFFLDEIAGRYRVQSKYMGQWYEFPANGDTIRVQLTWIVGWKFDWKISLPMLDNPES